MPRVIGFAGKIGSGKTALTKLLAAKLGWPRMSLGDYVRSVVRQRGLKQDRETLQTVGTELLRADPSEFCREAIMGSGWKPGQNLLIDGMRHVETIPIIESITSPAKFDLVFIKVSEPTRLRRLEGPEGTDANFRAHVEAHSSEAQVTTTLAGLAALTVDGDNGIEKIAEKVVTWIAITNAS